MPRHPLICLAAVASLAVAGCGQTDEDEVRSTTESFVTAFQDGDWGEVCSLLTPQAKTQIAAAGALMGGGGCEKAMQSVAGLMSEADRKKLQSNEIRTISIRGDSATVTYGKNQTPTELRRADGEWRIHAESSR